MNYGAPRLETGLFFGNRLNRLVEFPVPTRRNPYRVRKSQPQALFDDLPPFSTLGQALDTVRDDDGEVLDFSPRKKSFLDMVPEGANWRALPLTVQQESMGRAWFAKGGRSGWWRRLSRDLPCPTIVTMPNHASTSMCHPTETRALSLMECAAVQEFPPAWIFNGTTTQRYVQVGNALPRPSRRGCGRRYREGVSWYQRPRHTRAPSVPTGLPRLARQNTPMVQERCHVRMEGRRG